LRGRVALPVKIWSNPEKGLDRIRNLGYIKRILSVIEERLRASAAGADTPTVNVPDTLCYWGRFRGTA
jgi:hypothetical protein